MMTTDRFERMRVKLFGGHNQNAFAPLLKDRSGITGPIQGSPEEFSQILYELTNGDLEGRNGTVTYEVAVKDRRDLLKFKDGSLFRAVRTKGSVVGTLIVVTPHLPSMDDLLNTEEAPLSSLVVDVLTIREAFKHVADEYKQDERKQAAEKAATEVRMSRESKLDAVLETIEKAKSGETVMIRGQQNIDALVNIGFVPHLVDNPDNWIDAEEFPGMRYRHGQSGIEVLLTGREKFRPVEELHRLEFTFLVHRSDDDPATFRMMARKYRETAADGTPYSLQQFHDDLTALVKYPEELKGRTEEDLGLMADEVGHVMDKRQVLDKGILPYEALFRKDAKAIVAYVQQNKTPAREIRKALDYCEYTGMIDAQFKSQLQQQIAAATSAAVSTRAAEKPVGDMLYDKRVKEIVAEVLRKIPKERLTPKSVTLALAPYVNELGYSRLVKIRERILQLKGMVHDQQERAESLR